MMQMPVSGYFQGGKENMTQTYIQVLQGVFFNIDAESALNIE